ncbi:serine/threonine protein kinase [Kitasatospora sp. NBC_01287]|uniref:serine/threonine-protein kinase n=1 Tax=Kitasatospora sp. NBC_01287 TaxID=2903573 RepID=UPI002259E111|nr:serine/threonine-protein kinase [Kitasatospora sp. NBC_01287]MCX4750857.1 serine/threonine protein kinase [Kitasatospora sp. NBC_01287]
MEALGAADPRQLGGYRLLRRLGAGGMGQVYLGRTAGGRTVAVKTVRAEYAADHEFRVRFRQEVAAARQVGGRWTAPVLDADTEGPQPWVATGYVAGPALGTAVREFGPLPGAAVRALGFGLAEALATVHGLGLVHRDVKPSNVLLALDGPRLIDFGITRAMDAATALTRSGFVVGSPGFLSPEQAQGLLAGPPSDIFSLGAVLAYAATGDAPFGEGVSAPVLLYRVLHEEPDLARLSSVDPALRALVAACLAKDPQARPTPVQLRAALASDGEPALALERRDWLPAPVAGALARLAVELLDLDGATGAGGSNIGGSNIGDPRIGAPQIGGGHATGAGLDGTGRAAPAFTRTAGSAPGSVHGAAHGSAHGATPPPAPTYAPTPSPGALPTAVPGGRPPRGRGLLTVLLAAVVAAAVAGTAVWLTDDHGSTPTAATTQQQSHQQAPTLNAATGTPGSGTHPGTSAPPAAPDSPSAAGAAAAGAVPSAFLGTWQGKLSSPQFSTQADFRITIAQGQVGDPVATIHNNTGPGTAYCDDVGSLTSAAAERLVITSEPTTGLSGCIAITLPQIYTRNANGTLHLVIDGVSGDLAKTG